MVVDGGWWWLVVVGYDAYDVVLIILGMFAVTLMVVD